MRNASVLHNISILEAAVGGFKASFPRSFNSLEFFSTSERCKIAPFSSDKWTAILNISFWDTLPGTQDSAVKNLFRFPLPLPTRGDLPPEEKQKSRHFEMLPSQEKIAEKGSNFVIIFFTEIVYLQTLFFCLVSLESRPVPNGPIVLVKCWKLTHRNAKNLLKIAKNPKRCYLNFKKCYLNGLIFLCKR